MSRIKINKQSLLILISCAGISCAPTRACAQGTDADLPDSPSQTAQSSRESSDAPEEREVSWRTLPRDFLHDQKAIWLFPAQLAKGRHWIPTLAITVVTTGFIAPRPHVISAFLFNNVKMRNLNYVFQPPRTTAAHSPLPPP